MRGRIRNGRFSRRFSHSIFHVLKVGTNMPAIEILGFQKNYTVGFWRKKQRTGLKPLSLSIESNEVFGFLGPNGAGKTTTIKLLMGLIFPSAGTAKILGMDWRDPEVRSVIGFLPEQPKIGR